LIKEATVKPVDIIQNNQISQTINAKSQFLIPLATKDNTKNDIFETNDMDDVNKLSKPVKPNKVRNNTSNSVVGW